MADTSLTDTSPANASEPNIEYDSATESDSEAEDLGVTEKTKDLDAIEEDVDMINLADYPQNQLALPENQCWFSCECVPMGSGCRAKRGSLELDVEVIGLEDRDRDVQVPDNAGKELDIDVFPSSGGTAVEIRIRGGDRLINPVFNFNIQLGGGKRAEEGEYEQGAGWRQGRARGQTYAKKKV